MTVRGCSHRPFGGEFCWNVLRRTGYPDDLYFPFASSGNCRVLPQRFIVPTSEAERNSNIPNEDNYGVYTPGKTWWEVIFWARLIQGETQ